MAHADAHVEGDGADLRESECVEEDVDGRNCQLRVLDVGVQDDALVRHATCKNKTSRIKLITLIRDKTVKLTFVQDAVDLTVVGVVSEEVHDTNASVQSSQRVHKNHVQCQAVTEAGI